MKYDLLSKYYYIDSSSYEREYIKRKEGIGTIRYGIKIKESDSFMVMVPEITRLISEIYKKNSNIEKQLQILPGIARERYMRSCLVDEIILTNDIEGVRSTQKEIRDVIDESNGNPEKRFLGLVRKYEMLLKERVEIPVKECADVRRLYDEIVSREIDQKDAPDGKLFRKGTVIVLSPTQKVKHEGVFPEEKIDQYMVRALDILNSEDGQTLINAAVFHYLFGYIHPYYDGNGRLNRFITSYILSRELSPIAAYRISYAIKNDKNYYYKAFDVCNDPKNKGDVTPFVIMFLELINRGMTNLQEKISDGIEKLSYYKKQIEVKYSETTKKNEYQRRLLFLLAQNELFADEALDRDLIAKFSNLSYQTVTKVARELMKSGAPLKETKDGRKIIYRINLDKL